MTRILGSMEPGDSASAEELLPLVYDELRRMAGAKLAGERPGQTLQATALVHEAYLQLVGDAPVAWRNRRHFFAAAAEAMRRILIQNARRKLSRKRGGGAIHEALRESRIAVQVPEEELLAVDEALEKLASEHPESATLVKLRYFVGMTLEEVAAAMDRSPRSVDRLWAYARSWLRREMQDHGQ